MYFSILDFVVYFKKNHLFDYDAKFPDNSCMTKSILCDTL